MKRMILRLFVFAGLFHATSSFGQSGEYLNTMSFSSMPSAPQSSEITKYGSLPLDYSTGAPIVSVPIFSQAVRNDISVDVSLTYNTNGIKVQELSGLAGHGWNLFAGGAITLTVNDVADILGVNLARNLQNANALQVEMSVDYPTNPLKRLVFDDNNESQDSQPDLYNFNFFGHSGQFFIDSGNVYIIDDHESLKIERQPGDYVDWNFKVTDKAGNIFYFGGVGAIEHTQQEVTTTTYVGAFGGTTTAYPTNGWNLKKVLTPQGDSIVFTYNLLGYNYVASTQKKNLVSRSTLYFPLTMTCDCYDYPMQSSQMLTGTQNFLTKIKINELNEVNFAYTPHPDIAGARLVETISVKDLASGSNTKKVNLYYQFTSKERPFLDSVKICDSLNANCERYSFLYESPSSLPLRESNSYDIWGYYNGASDRGINHNLAKSGLLKKVTYPTGGSDSFEYSGNSNYERRLKNQRHYGANISGYGTGDHTAVPYTVQWVVPSLTTRLQVWGQATFESEYDPTDLDKMFIYARKKGGSDVLLVGDRVPGNTLMTFEFDEDYPVAPGDTLILKIEPSGEHLHGEAGFIYFSNDSVIGNVDYGGLRVNRLFTYDPFSKVRSVKRYEYKYMTGETSGLSLPYDDEESFFFENTCLEIVGSTTFIGRTGCRFNFKTDYNRNQLFAQLPAPMLYRSVLEYHGENGEAGLTEYLYDLKVPERAVLEYVSNIPNLKYLEGTNYDGPYSLWGRGISRQSAINQYRKNGSVFSPVSKQEFKYSKRAVLKELKGYIVQRVNNVYEFNADFQSFLHGHVRAFTYQSAWNTIDTVNITNFNEDGSSYYTKSGYQYYNTLKSDPSLIYTKTSDGEELAEMNLYAPDYLPNADFIKEMQDAHIYGKPVEQLSLFKKSGVWRVKSGVFNEYLVTNPAILSKQYALRLDGSKALSTFKVSNRALGSGMETFTKTTNSKSTDYGYWIQNTSFDSRQNPLTITDSKTNSRAHLYAHQNQFLVAEVVNASTGQYAYTSFEDNSQKGYWNYAATIGSGIVADANAPSGLYVYNLPAGTAITKTGLTSTQQYTVSFFYKGTIGPLVTGATSYKTTLMGDYTFYEATITGVTTASVSFAAGSGTTKVDELRLYPANAQMKTYSYKPSVGIITTCSEAGTPTYYTYDSRGRLSLVKDHNRFIVDKVDTKINTAD